MRYIPKFIHFDHFVNVSYPFGINWKYDYVHMIAESIYNTYEEDIKKGIIMSLIARGTSGAMIAGAVLTELHYLNPFTNARLLIVRKKEDNAHSRSLTGAPGNSNSTRTIVIDDFIGTGATIKEILKILDSHFGSKFLCCVNKAVISKKRKYDMLCISNPVDNLKTSKEDSHNEWDKIKDICSRFEYVVCCPKPE